jgi:hypothetical protein
VIYWLAADEVSIWSAVALAVLSVFATPAWSSASRALWQHGPSMLLLALALLIQRRDGPLFWVGLLLGFAYVVRPTNLVPLAAAALWALLSRPRRMPAFLAGAAVVLVPFMIANLSTYAHPLPPYYRPGFYGANAFKGEALAGHLVSPGRGLFVYSPLFLLSFAGAALKARSRSLTLLDLSLAGCVVAHWIVLSTTNANWWGGGSYGPRLFTDVVPYLMYFLIPVFAWVESARGARRVAVAAVVAVTSLISVAVHAQGALNKSTGIWNGYPNNIDQDPERVWDWRRPQFLAGITFVPAPLPPVNFGAVACVDPPGPPGTPMLVSNRGGTVILRWAPAAGGVAMYFLEIGDAPGSRNLGTRDIRNVLEPSFMAQRVPRGTYYVRARAKNGCGDSPPSPDLCVVVQ